MMKTWVGVGVLLGLMGAGVGVGAAPTSSAESLKVTPPVGMAPVSLVAVTNPADIVFMYPVSHALEVAYQLKNSTADAVAISIDYSLVDRKNQARDTQHKTLDLPANGVGSITFSTDASHLLFGQYSAILVVKRGNDVVIRNGTLLGVISSTDLPKAKPGEFLFGLDTSLSACYQDARLLRFTQLLGTDIIRGGVAMWPDLRKTWDEQVRVAMPIYEKYQLKICCMFDPPDTRIKDPMGYMSHVLQTSEMVARDYKSISPYFELGNEPDIGFFQGPMQMYLDGYRKIREAIKRGNPDAIVMNGGWAYDQKRINEFYTLAKPADLDVIAYHGHGDIQAEMRAHQIDLAIATKNGFGDKTMVDTETGIMAVSSAQEDIQANVCVEKAAFAQSIHAPYFNWFRLSFEHPDSYGCTIDRTQPRLSVMAYRATVETLRGFKFSQQLALPFADVQAYLFEQIGGPGRACVMWVDGRSPRQAFLRLAGASEVSTADVYGNHQPFKLLEGDIAAVPLSDNPVWLCWKNGGSAPAVVEPSLIEAPGIASLQQKASSPMQVIVRNPLDRSADATLAVDAQSDTPLTIAPANSRFQLAAHETKKIDLTATVGEVHDAVTWPAEWTVFVHTKADIDPASITEIPAALPGDGVVEKGSVKPTQQILRSEKIDLQTLADFHVGQEKVPAMVMGYVDSVDDRTVTMGAGADFWMQWAINGQAVFDDLPGGNGPGYTPFDHLFEMHLKKGRNLLVCKVLSGSHGFTLAIGSPDEIERASGNSTRNTVRFTYQYDKTNAVTQTVGVEYLRPVEPLDKLAIDAPIDAWERFVPNIVLADRNVVNLHFKDPDASLWWKGYGDLSAVAWLRGDAKNLYLVIKVTDDVHRPAPDASRLADFDSVALAVSPSGKEDVTEYRIGQVGDKTAVVKIHGSDAPASSPDGVTADVQRGEDSTLYRITLNRKVTGDVFNLNLMVNDNDAGSLKQYLEWKPGMSTLSDSANWYQVRLADGP